MSHPNMKLTPLRAAAALAAVFLLLAGCATTPPLPKVTYPITYQIGVGNTQVTTSAGPQNTNQSATQQVTVEPGETFYYQVVSPVAVTLSVYEAGAGGHTLLGQMQGASFTSSIVPQTSSLEFSFAVSEANTGGTVQFTLSDRPIAPAVTP